MSNLGSPSTTMNPRETSPISSSIKNYQIGLVRNPHQIEVFRYFENQEGQRTTENKIYEISELEMLGPHLLLLGPDLSDEDKAPLLQSTQKWFPIVACEQAEINQLQDAETADRLLKKYLAPWALLHNLNTLEEVFQVGRHLGQLWTHDRTGFIEDFWALLKSNFAPIDLSIYFHDVVRAEKEHEKDRLVWVKAISAGHGRHAEIVPCEDIDHTLIEAYRSRFVGPLDILDSDNERGHYTWSITINKSPILVLMKSHCHGTLALTLIKAIVTGLQTSQTPNTAGAVSSNSKKGPLH